MDPVELKKIVDQIFAEFEIDAKVKENASRQISLKLAERASLSHLKAKLGILFEYEKHYLELIKAYKEEIKFAGSIQEDLRKERAKFFSETLKDVSATLKESQVDESVAAMWLKELANSYTKSLDISSGLIEEQTMDMIGKIRSEAKLEIKSASIDDNP